MIPENPKRPEIAVQNACRLVLTLGQDATPIEQIERRLTHPAMAGFGLWRDDPSLERLANEQYQARRPAPTRLRADM